MTPENNRLRHLLYGHKPDIYRVIYLVLEKQKHVEILHVRHGEARVQKRFSWGPKTKRRVMAYFDGSRLMNCREAEFMQ
jgi:hypothetical protein